MYKVDWFFFAFFYLFYGWHEIIPFDIAYNKVLISFALFHQFISSIWTQKAYKNDQFTRFNLDYVFVIKICQVKNINRNMNMEQIWMNKMSLTIKFNTNIKLQKKFFQIQLFFWKSSKLLGINYIEIFFHDIQLLNVQNVQFTF